MTPPRYSPASRLLGWLAILAILLGGCFMELEWAPGTDPPADAPAQPFEPRLTFERVSPPALPMWLAPDGTDEPYTPYAIVVEPDWAPKSVDEWVVVSIPDAQVFISDVDSEVTCPSTTVPLYVDRHVEAGQVAVWNDVETLFIRAHASEPWRIIEVHIYAGPPPLPVNPAEIPPPGRFPYSSTLSEAADTMAVDVPLEALGASCGDELLIAVHAGMLGVDEAGDTFDSTGWAGDEPFDLARWGWLFHHMLCCD